MDVNVEFFILCFSSLFTLINPIGLVPIFISITQDYTRKERDIIALKAVIFSFFILVLFGAIGEFIFSFYNITINGFRIAGGILLLKISFDMIESKRSRTKTTPKEEKEAERAAAKAQRAAERAERKASAAKRRASAMEKKKAATKKKKK